MVERQFQVVERQTQVAERRSGPFRLNLTTGDTDGYPGIPLSVSQPRFSFGWGTLPLFFLPFLSFLPFRSLPRHPTFSFLLFPPSHPLCPTVLPSLPSLSHMQLGGLSEELCVRSPSRSGRCIKSQSCVTTVFTNFCYSETRKSYSEARGKGIFVNFEVKMT